jgi:hypothetical protein
MYSGLAWGKIILWTNKIDKWLEQKISSIYSKHATLLSLCNNTKEKQ